MIFSTLNTSIKQACQLLENGDLVVIPTETVYGLAADATNDRAVAKIYELKNRPSFNPLIMHVPNVTEAEKWAQFTAPALLLAETFWKTNHHHRPLTLVLNRKKDTHLSHLATAGLDTVAMRVPNHPIALELLKHFQKPLAAPSANRSNHISPTSIEAVKESFGAKTPFTLDGGVCSVGLESTIVDMTTAEPILLRPGGTTKEEIEEIIGVSLKLSSSSTCIKAPGMLKRHYAPNHPLRLNVVTPFEGEVLLGFGPNAPSNTTLNLSKTGDLREAAANLFQMLRVLDQQTCQGIAVMPVPHHGLGLAINDRLKRAASEA
jgi:L-threonylcarbamoyladenylate synthase